MPSNRPRKVRMECRMPVRVVNMFLLLAERTGPPCKLRLTGSVCIWTDTLLLEAYGLCMNSWVKTCHYHTRNTEMKLMQGCYRCSSVYLSVGLSVRPSLFLPVLLSCLPALVLLVYTSMNASLLSAYQWCTCMCCLSYCTSLVLLQRGFIRVDCIVSDVYWWMESAQSCSSST